VLYAPFAVMLGIAMRLDERMYFPEVTQRKHVARVIERPQLHIGQRAHEVITDTPRRKWRVPSRYDQCGHVKIDEIAESRWVIERCPEIKRHFVDPACKRDSLRIWQGIPRTVAGPVVDKAPHCSDVVAAIDGACDSRCDFGDLPEGALVLIVAVAQQVKCSRLDKRHALQMVRMAQRQLQCDRAAE